MKGTPFKTLRSSPFMQPEGGVGGALQEPEVTKEQDLMQEPVVAPQMQDTDPYKGKAELYSSELDYAAKEYGSSSVEDIGITLGELGGNLDVAPEDIFDGVLNEYKILGDNEEFNDGKAYTTARGVRKKIFPYGNIESVQQDDGKYIETISITAENHPLYGNTYTRTEMDNPDHKTKKPFKDLAALISGYESNFMMGPPELITEGMVDGTIKGGWSFKGVGLPGVSREGGKMAWTHSQQRELEDLIDGMTKNGEPISDEENSKLKEGTKNIFRRYSRPTITKTTLKKE